MSYIDEKGVEHEGSAQNLPPPPAGQEWYQPPWANGSWGLRPATSNPPVTGPHDNPTPTPGATTPPPAAKDDWSTGDWDAARVSAYFKSRGVTPNGSSPDYWATQWNDWGKKDPAYFLQRLSAADEFGGGGSGGGGGAGIPGGLLASFPGQFGQGPPQYQQPGFRQAPAFSYQPFKAPTAQDVLADPSYQFRLNQGEGALQGSAAAKGLLNTGGTLKDILGYGQQFASNEYGNIWNRDYNTYQQGFGNALSAYNTNYGTQYRDPYNADVAGAQSTFNNAQTGYTDAYNAFLDQYKRWDDQRKFVADELDKQADRGVRTNA